MEEKEIDLLINLNRLRMTDSIIVNSGNYTYKASLQKLYESFVSYMNKTNGEPIPYYSKPRLDITTRDSYILIFECKSKTPAKYKWYKNGQLISEDFFNSSYILDKSLGDYLGNYFVIVENENGYIVSDLLQVTE